MQIGYQDAPGTHWVLQQHKKTHAEMKVTLNKIKNKQLFKKVNVLSKTKMEAQVDTLRLLAQPKKDNNNLKTKNNQN